MTCDNSSDEKSSDDSASEESEYRLSDDSSLSSLSSASSASSDSSDSPDSADTPESSSDRRRRLHRERQARYAAKKRQHAQQQLHGQVPSKSASTVAAVVAVAKRRLSSSAHISPTMLPVVKAQVVSPTQQLLLPVPATVIKARPTARQQQPVNSPLHAAKQQALLMSPLTLGLPAPALAAPVPSIIATRSSPPSSFSSLSTVLDTTEPFLNVSVDIFYVVLSFLHPIDLLRLAAVSSSANLSTSDPSIWRPLVHQPWPITCTHTHDWKRVYCTRIKRAIAGARYLCTYCACTRTFKQDGMLDAHTARHSQQPTVYTCTVAGCGLSFDTARRLRYHVKRHSGGTVASKVHRCDWSGCTLTFPTPYALSLHRCRHTGQKRPHACRHAGCTRSFNSRHALALHADTHNARTERTLSFACGVSGCGRTFLSKGGLAKHAVKAHSSSGERVRLVCEEGGCCKEFYYRSEMKAHMRKKHKRVGVEMGVKAARVKV